MVARYKYPLTAHEIAELVGQNPLILEIGCNDGTDTERFLEAMPDATIHCFEPDKRAIDRFIVRQISSETLRCNTTIHCLALSDINGMAPFWASGGRTDNTGPGEWNKSGSLRTPTGHLAQLPEITFQRPAPVQCMKLDSWCEWREISRIDFIWMDVQGAEDLVIRGGRRALASTRYIYTEFSDIELYEGQRNLSQLCEMLPDFELLGIYQRNNALFRNTKLTGIKNG